MVDQISQGLGTEMMTAKLDLGSETLVYMSLHTSALTVTATDRFWSDVSSTEVTSANYDASGQILVSTTVTGVGSVTTFDASDAAWGPVSFAGVNVARSATVWYNLFDSEVSPVIAQYDFGSNQTVESGTFTVQINSAGLLTIS